MRIISGTHKGRRITAPKQLPVRPTTDMAKEALFNILNNRFYFEEISVLDLYSGTGNLSYEFASRGCESITAVDSDRKCIKFIQATTKTFDFPISAINNEALGYLEMTRSKFDLIIADPPYGQPPEDFLKLHELVFQRKLLNDGGQLIIEHSRHSNLSMLDHFVDQRKYGGSIFSFFGLGGEQ